MNIFRINYGDKIIFNLFQNQMEMTVDNLAVDLVQKYI